MPQRLFSGWNKANVHNRTYDSLWQTQQAHPCFYIQLFKQHRSILPPVSSSSCMEGRDQYAGVMLLHPNLAVYTSTQKNTTPGTSIKRL
jgi:hypothetical protein